MNKLIDMKRFRFYLWLGLAFFVVGVLAAAGGPREKFISSSIISLWNAVFLVVFNFILFEFTLPFIKLDWKRIIAGLLFLAAHVVVYSAGLNAWNKLGTELSLYVPLKVFATEEEGCEYHMGVSMASVLFFGIIRHVYNHIKLRQSTQQLRIEKQRAELNYLKSQTNPHFLFNTLNNIFSLARNKSDLAPESILRLSKILRFMLYETGGEYIPIENEIKIIGDYIALEKLRYDESLVINFSHDVEDMRQALPPLLLIPLVENAFKHGVSETINKPFISIHLSVNKRQLLFTVKNSTQFISGEQKGVKESIGLSNLRRQLELLYTDYNLSVKQDQSDFTVVLKINLASHV